MEKLYENIRNLRIKKGISQDELAALAGYKDRSSIAKIEAGKVDLAQSKILLFAKLLGVTPASLMGIDSTDTLPANCRPVTTHRIPMLGNIACGEPIFADQDFEYRLELGDSINADFCLRATGDSMTGDRINDGDIVFIRQQPAVDNDRIAAVLIDDSATLKHVYYSQAAATLQLVASNPAYAPQIYSGQELENVRILGLAVAFMSPLA